MKYTSNRDEKAPSSAETLGTLSGDGMSSIDEGRSEKRNRNSNRHRRRKGEKKRNDRYGKEAKKMLTPVVQILLFGVLLSFLDVLYIFHKLENSSEMSTTENSSAVTEVIAERKVDSNARKNENFIEKKEENKSEKIDPIIGREPIVKLIRDADISFDPVEDADLIEELPLWSDVVEIYGPEPVIYGINEGNCERFQAQTDKGDHFIGTAGTFNSGTNLLSELLIANCIMPDHMKKYGNKSRGIRWQVPWGKHSPVGDKEYRETHKTLKDKAVDANEIMPMVTIRDPLIWLKSMCRHKYTARWKGFQEEYCPNFGMKDLEMTVKYDGFRRSYESVLHLWNDYYNEYKNVDIPFLLVRFEDLVFHAEETVTKICKCGGGMRSSTKFRYIVNSAKKGEAAHGAMSQRTGYVDALVKYGKLDKRYKGFDIAEDLEYVRDNIDQSIMEMMHYASIDPSWKKNQQKTPI